MKVTKHRLWLCALLICMVLSILAGIAAPPAMAANISSTDWMETVPDETKLSNMSIPGTHDSCTQYVDMRYIFQCQDASVATQLIYGYRYLDMRLVLEQKHDQQTLVLKHNIARCKTSNSPFAGTLTLDDVLRDVYAFLVAHPTETIILCMKAENSKDDVADVQSALYERIDTDPDRWYLKNEIPTLGEVRGKSSSPRGLTTSWRSAASTAACTLAGPTRATAPFWPTPPRAPQSMDAKHCACRTATTMTRTIKSAPSEPVWITARRPRTHFS